MFGVEEFPPFDTHPPWNPDEATARGIAGGNATASAAAPAIIRLPPAGSVGNWLAALVDRDGPEEIVRQLVLTLTAEHVIDIVEKLCAREFGEEPIISGDDGPVRRRAPALACHHLTATCSLVSLAGGCMGGHAKRRRDPHDVAARKEAAAHDGQRRVRVPP